MVRLFHSIFPLMFCITNLWASEQVIDLFPSLTSGPRLHVNRIFPMEDRMDLAYKTRLKVWFSSEGLRSVSGDGQTMIVNKYLVKNVDNDIRVIQVFFDKREQRIYQGINSALSMDGKWLVYHNVKNLNPETTESITTLHVYDVENEREAFQYVREEDDSGFFLNNNASFIYLSWEDKSIERINGQFIVRDFNPPISPGFISSSGNRIINPHQMKYIDRVGEGWTEPKDIYYLSSDGAKVPPQINAIANDGHTIVSWDKDLGLVLHHEKDGVWSQPEAINYRSGYETRYFSISENGLVMVFEGLVKIRSDTDYYHSVFVLYKNPSGKWIHKQANPPNTFVAHGTLLTADGSKVFWIPHHSYLSSIPWAEYLK